MKKWALPMLLLLAMGCWSSEGDQPATVRPDAAPRDPAASLAMWEWPAAAGERRDLASDHAECLRKADAQSKPMMRVGVLWDCMRTKGWHRIKEQFTFDSDVLRAPWIWVGDSAEKRDMAADEQACNEPQVEQGPPSADLERFFACMEQKGWKRNEAIWKKRLSSSP